MPETAVTHDRTDAGGIPPRPTQLTPEMKLHAARATVERLVASGVIPTTDADASAQDIAKCGRRGMDGYELAKALETYYGWDCDLEVAEELDAFSYNAHRELESAERAWAEQHGIKPPFPDGTRVRLRRGGTGVIDHIYEHGPARYAIAMDDDEEALGPHRRRLIVNFEDVTKLDPDET